MFSALLKVRRIVGRDFGEGGWVFEQVEERGGNSCRGGLRTRDNEQAGFGDEFLQRKAVAGLWVAGFQEAAEQAAFFNLERVSYAPS